MEREGEKMKEGVEMGKGLRERKMGKEKREKLDQGAQGQRQGALGLH